MLNRIKWYFCFLMALGCTAAYAQQSQLINYLDSLKKAPELTVEAMHADLNFMKHALEEAHPTLYRYHEKREIDSCFNETLSQINHPMPELEYWRLMTQLVSHIGSGHTEIWPSREALIRYINQRKHILPFGITVVQNKLYVSRNYIRSITIPQGAQILAINGRTNINILATLRAHLPGEGYSNAFKDSKLQNTGFTWNYWQVFGESAQYEIAYRDSLGNRVKQTVKGLITTRWPSPAPLPKSAKPYQLTYLEEAPNAAILRIATFADKNFVNAYDSIFTEIKKRKIQNLVIDLRGNGGGLFASIRELMRYMANGRFKMALYGESVVA